MNQNKEKEIRSCIEMFHILTFTHQTPKEELGLKRYRIVEYISSTFESSVSVLLFHEFRRKGTVMRRTETDSKGERRKVCLFFFPFIYLDNSDLPLSLSPSVCLFLSLSLLSLCFHFTTERLPAGDSSSWFSFKLLAFCFTAEDMLQMFDHFVLSIYIYVCVVVFIRLVPSHHHSLWFTTKFNL